MDKKALYKLLLGTLVLIITLSCIYAVNYIAYNDDLEVEGYLNITDSKEGNITVHYEACGKCFKVVDGDTIWVEGIGKIRFVGVDTPERGEPGYYEAKDFVKKHCLGKTVYLDIDNAEEKDKYNRTLAIVYTEDMNLNKVLLEKGYAEIMYIPPSEFERGLGTI